MTAPAPSPRPPWRRHLARAGAAAARLLDNPLLLKELRGAFRRRRYLLLLTGLLGAVGLAVVVTLFAMTRALEEDPAQVGQHTFVAFYAVEAALVLLVFPAFSCTAVVEEKTNRSLDLLVTTRLGPGAIAWGKLLAALVYGLTFIAATAPLAALTFLYGGITPGQIAFSYLGLVVAAVLVASYGLLVSTLADTAARAVLRTFLLLPAVSLVGLGPVAWLVVVFVVGPLLHERDMLQARDWVLGLDAGNQVLLYAGVLAWTAMWVGLFLVTSVDRLKPPRADRATGIRAWFLAVWSAAVGLLLLGAAHNAPLTPTFINGLLAQVVLVVLVVFLLIVPTLVTEPTSPPPPPRAPGRLEPLRALLRPGAGRAAVFLSLLVLGTAAAALALGLPHLGARRTAGVRSVDALLAAALPWATVYLLAAVLWALFLARRLGPVASRLVFVGSLLLTGVYPAFAFHLSPAHGRSEVDDLAFVSPWTATWSAVLHPPPHDRRLVLFGPTGEEVRERLKEIGREAEREGRRGDRAVRRRIAREREAYLTSLPGVPAHTAATAFYGLLLVALLGAELARRRRRLRPPPPGRQSPA